MDIEQIILERIKANNFNNDAFQPRLTNYGYILIFDDEYILKKHDIYYDVRADCWLYCHEMFIGKQYKEIPTNLIFAKKGKHIPPKRFPDSRPYPYGY